MSLILHLVITYSRFHRNGLEGKPLVCPSFLPNTAISTSNLSETYFYNSKKVYVLTIRFVYQLPLATTSQEVLSAMAPACLRRLLLGPSSLVRQASYVGIVQVRSISIPLTRIPALKLLLDKNLLSSSTQVESLTTTHRLGKLQKGIARDFLCTQTLLNCNYNTAQRKILQPKP